MTLDQSVRKGRDKHVDIMLFWGILFVVMGHKFQPEYWFFEAYTFHMGFFFFISGYLFKVKNVWSEKLTFIQHKFKSQVLLYFVFNAFFFALAYGLRRFDIALTNDFSWHNFFIEPFISGHQNSFMIPSWFLLNLFLVNVIMQAAYIKSTHAFKWGLMAILTLVALIGMYQGLKKHGGFELVLVRTAFALLFFQVGILVRTYKAQWDKWLLNLLTLLALTGIVLVMMHYFGPLKYSIVWGSIENERVYIPLISTTLIIFICYALTSYIARFIKEDNIMVLIGQNSFYIMVLHLSIFFLINVGYYWAGLMPKEELSHIYACYHVEQTYLLYEIPAFVVPTLLGLWLKKRRQPAASSFQSAAVTS